MKTKIAINGFGRIGRVFFRHAFECPDMEIIAVNDLIAPEVMAYLLKYDTVYGPYEKPVEIKNNELIVGGKKIKILQEKDPNLLPCK
jgi:glyceraldehyde 3-phosphate dehydrogenase